MRYIHIAYSFLIFSVNNVGMGYGYPEYMTDLPDGDKVGVSDQVT